MFSLVHSSFWFCMLLMVVEMTCFVLQIYFMSQVIRFLQEYADGRTEGLDEAYLFALGIALATLLFVTHAFHSLTFLILL